jgi:hypothetical protein
MNNHRSSRGHFPTGVLADGLGTDMQIARHRSLRRILLAIAFTVVPATGALAQAPRVVDVTHEPSHHLALSNERVRVFNVIVAAHATTLIHRHDRDYLFVTLGDADVVTQKVGEAAVPLSLHDGEVHFAAGGFAHTAAVSSDHPFHNTTIELLKPSTHLQPCTASCAEPVPCSVVRGGTCPTVTRVYGSDEWTAVTVTLPPKGRLDLIDGTGPALVVAVSDMSLAHGGPASGDAPMRGGAGTLGWVSAAATPMGTGHVAARSLINVSTAPARFVMVEFRNGG